MQSNDYSKQLNSGYNVYEMCIEMCGLQTSNVLLCYCVSLNWIGVVSRSLNYESYEANDSDSFDHVYLFKANHIRANER